MCRACGLEVVVVSSRTCGGLISRGRSWASPQEVEVPAAPKLALTNGLEELEETCPTTECLAQAACWEEHRKEKAYVAEGRQVSELLLPRPFASGGKT